MCDFFDDFDNDDFMDDDSSGDGLEGEMNQPMADNTELDDQPDEDGSQDDDSVAKAAFIIGGSMVWELEEEEGRGQKKRKGFGDD
jgi:hypothetical protein